MIVGHDLLEVLYILLYYHYQL